MSDAAGLRKAGLAPMRPARYLLLQDSGARTVMVAIGIIFGFLALFGILNLIEFKRFD